MASLGLLLEGHGYKISIIKMDPYINIDPGTMSPFQHGEVYVTEDGAETDLDLGYYERFTNAESTPEKLGLHRPDLQHRHPARAAGRLPGQDGPGDPPYHQRDQEADL